MGLWRRSLEEDSVDRYNHTLSVLFLLLLSLVTWLLPLFPSLQPANHSTAFRVPHRDSSSDGLDAIMPKLHTKAACWCPQHYTSNMVNYANSVCSSGLRNAIQGKKSSHGAYVYPPPSGIRPAATRPEDFEFKLNVTFPKSASRQRLVNRNQVKELNEAWTFMRIETPCTLFLLALGLALPHLVCMLLSSLLSNFNIGQTLAETVGWAGFDPDTRRHLYKDLAHSLDRATSSCSWTAAMIYLLLKTLAFIAAMIGLLIVHGDSLPRAWRLKNKVTHIPSSAFEDKMSGEMKASKETLMTAGNIDLESLDGTMLLCDFSISQIANFLPYTLQCHFNVELETEAFLEPSMPELSKVLHAPTPTICEIYVTLYLMVQTHLLLLTIVNVFSLITWVAKLFIGPCKSKVTSGKGHLPLDAVFLLQMAMENAGPEVAQGLSQAWPSGDKSETEEEGLALSE